MEEYVEGFLPLRQLTVQYWQRVATVTSSYFRFVASRIGGVFGVHFRTAFFLLNEIFKKKMI